MAFNPNLLQQWSVGVSIPGGTQFNQVPQSFGYYAGKDTLAVVLQVNYFNVFAFNSNSVLYESRLQVNDQIFCVCADGNFWITVTSISPQITTVLSSFNFNIQLSVYCSTTANLNATYTNGVSGVGAQLVNAGTQVAFSVDGVTPAVNSRVLVKDQSSQYENGIYYVLNAGSGSTNWVLQRTNDYDLAPSQIFPGNLIVVDYGTMNAGSTWIETATVNVIGTDPIVFSLFNQFVGMKWLVVTTNTVMVPNVGYIPNSGSLITFTLPATFTVGQTFAIAGYGAGGWKLQLGAGQVIKFGNDLTSSGGFLSSTASGDGLELVSVLANTNLIVVPGSQGNITFA